MTVKTIETPHPDIAAALPLWDLPRTLWGGTRSMRSAAEKYLPREPAEDLVAYSARLNRTVLFNAFKKTVMDMTGRVFAKEILLGEDVPEAIVTWSENIDMAGRHLSQFASDVMQDALQTGIAYILVDSPEGEGETRADQGRPYLVHIRAEDVIGWSSETIGEATRLTSFRFYETVEVTEGYHVERVRRIKVLTLGGFEVWSQNERKEWILTAEGARGIEAVPIVPVYMGRTGYMIGTPPLQDLADLNVAHWQSSSDQRNIVHVVRVPILFASGIGEAEGLVIGASMMTKATDPAASMQWVEHSGRGVEAGANDLASLEMQMQVQGLNLIDGGPAETATGEVRADVKENSRLSRWADSLKDAIENALALMAQIGGLGDDGGSVVVNKDFGIVARGVVDIQALIAAYQAGIISYETVLNEMVRRGFISDDVTPEYEAERLSINQPGEALETSGMIQ